SPLAWVRFFDVAAPEATSPRGAAGFASFCPAPFGSASSLAPAVPGIFAWACAAAPESQGWGRGRLAPAPDNPDKPRTREDAPHRPPALRLGRPGGGCSSRPSPGGAEETAGGVQFVHSERRIHEQPTSGRPGQLPARRRLSRRRPRARRLDEPPGPAPAVRLAAAPPPRQ